MSHLRLLLLWVLLSTGASVPTLTATPTVLANSGDSVTVAWEGVVDASPLDWIGVFTADNATFMAWTYVGDGLGGIESLAQVNLVLMILMVVVVAGCGCDPDNCEVENYDDV